MSGTAVALIAATYRQTNECVLALVEVLSDAPVAWQSTVTESI